MAFTFSYRLSLRNKFSSIFTVVICPAMYFRNFACPVAMTRANRCCPIKSCCPPWILMSYFSSFENGIEEIKNKHQLHRKYNYRDYSDHFIQLAKMIKIMPATKVKIATGYTGQSFIVHRPEYEVSADYCHPKMDEPKRIV